MSTNIKEEARRLIEKLPEDITWDDLMHQIYVPRQVRIGKVKVLWTDAAISQLQGIHDFIAQTSAE